jgi:hypothetical protein
MEDIQQHMEESSTPTGPRIDHIERTLEELLQEIKKLKQ